MKELRTLEENVVVQPVTHEDTESGTCQEIQFKITLSTSPGKHVITHDCGPNVSDFSRILVLPTIKLIFPENFMIYTCPSLV